VVPDRRCRPARGPGRMRLHGGTPHDHRPLQR
jgi:hypothetical protein